MAYGMSWIARYESCLRSVARIIIAFTFSLHGWQKFFGIFGNFHPPLSSLLGVAGVIETIGGALLILGLFTRPVAFILSGEMAIGYFHTHAPRSFWPIMNGGEVTVVYCFFFLWLSSAGPGRWSLDNLLGKDR